jgi:phage shock protein C
VKRLYLSDTDKKLGGVCGGLGEYFEKDPTLFRILFVLITLMWGAGLILYLIMWLVIPKKPKDTEKPAGQA